MKKSPANPSAVQVATQYWRGKVRVLELESQNGALDVHVSRPTDVEWVVEAHSSRSADAVVIVGSGATSAAAFTSAATQWAAQAAFLGLKTFDWKALAEALHAVNAIE